MRNALFATLLLTLTSPATAQVHSDEGGASVRPPFESMLENWRAENGESWRLVVDEQARSLELLHGGMSEGPLEPRDDAEWFAQARHFLDQTVAMHRAAPGTLVDDKVVFLPLGQGNTTDKMTVRMTQEVGGVPVEGASINLLFTTRGELLSIHNRSAVRVEGLNTQPSITQAVAATAVTRLFRAATGEVPTQVEGTELVIKRHTGARGFQADLAWRVDASAPGPDSEPISFRYWIDAHDGALIERVSRIHHFDVQGRITTLTTTGTSPDTAANPPSTKPVPFIDVVSPTAGTVTTDADGYFNFPGVNSPISVTLAYSGPLNVVVNDPSAGPGYSETFVQLPVGPVTQLVMNSSQVPLETAQANSLIGSDFLRDFIKTTIPTDTSLDFQVVSNTNLAAVCNAFYNGISVNFFPEGSGCVNTAYSTVIVHELGHWLNDIYGTHNGFDGMGEGNADVFAMYAYDDPIVGKDFAGPGNHIRNGMNTRQFCGDDAPACYGGVHADGEPWMGAAWKVRRNLNTTHGDAVGDMISSSLFLGWMNAYDQQRIQSIIEAQWLTLDDDDGNIDNGTPNYLDIDAGFTEQGFPGFDLTWVTFQNVTVQANTIDEAGPYTIDAQLAATCHPPVTAASLTYSVDTGPDVTVPMTRIAGSLWRASIPGQMAPSEVAYQLSATDGNSGSNLFPPRDDTLDFRVGMITVAHATSFEAATNEGWSSGAPSDTATTGMWEREDPLGTGAQPENDHTLDPGDNCWFTQQGSAGGGLGEADVDGGATTLFSPIFSMLNMFEPSISYWRWYSNNTGASPNADTFLVDVSNDGGLSWANVETIGPTGPGTSGGWQYHKFALGDFLPPTATVQVRYTASDLGNGSIVEACIDDFVADDLGPVTCTAPVQYCTSSPNSVGSGATITAIGSQSVASNTFGLRISGAPASTLGVAFYGRIRANAPFGDGIRCVRGKVFRLPLRTTSASGSHDELLDLTNAPHPNSVITVGSTWNFQFWYADPTGPGGTGSNATDGLEVTFCN
ncbi:MAG: hypothetical protein ACI8QZ_003270 [Chlamydiales bacterium]|jgi:hypothetical protein